MTDNSLIPRSVDISHRTYPGNSYYEMISKTVTDKLGEPYNACEDNTNGLKSPLAKEIEARGSRYVQRTLVPYYVTIYLFITRSRL